MAIFIPTALPCSHTGNTTGAGAPITKSKKLEGMVS
jgi:hypothetical protein